ncbi:MAG: CAP domain-containing protein [Rubrobacteraceae bacterium]|nr:CAP domain-containing protein [Rubrobacteraceae bacterium]
MAAGYETAEEVLQGWRNSPSHNHAMLDGNYHAIGIARLHIPGSKFGWYWTTDFGGVVEPAIRAPDEPKEDPQAQAAPEKLAEPTEVRPPELVKDLGGLENGTMHGQGAWKQEAKDGAKLILEDGYARLGGYHSGRDDLYQKIRVSTEFELLAYAIKITTAARERPSDRLVVRLTDEDGKQLAVLKKYTGEDARKWHRERLDLSRFVGQTVYLSFYVETDPTKLTTFYLDNLRLREAAQAPTSE